MHRLIAPAITFSEFFSLFNTKERSTWFAFPALTVEAGGVRGVLNVTDVGDVLVAESVVSASCDLNTLVACALVASFAVGVVNTS